MARKPTPSSRIDHITALIDRCLAEADLLPSMGTPGGARAHRPAAHGSWAGRR